MELQTPCTTCCDNGYSCCRNPQITWSLSEIDDLFSARPDLIETVVIFKWELPGFVYAISKEALSPDRIQNNETSLDYCTFYDHSNNCCSIYEYRPKVCSTYGDPEYNACPYQDMSDFDLLDLIIKEPQVAHELHLTAESHPKKFLKDFILPYSKSFMDTQESNPEYYELWKGFPNVNFERRSPADKPKNIKDPS